LPHFRHEAIEWRRTPKAARKEEQVEYQRSFGPRSLWLLAVAVLCLGVVLGPFAAAASADRDCPLVTDLKRYSVEIDNVVFVDEVSGMDGNRMRMGPENKDKFRLAVVTLRITKPAGERVTLAAADLTLHYYHGNEVEAAACEGLSVFSTSRDVDRPVKMPPHRGPGFVKQTTGTASTQAATLYVDAIFGYVEPDVSDVWIAVAQPSTPAPHRSNGWRNGGR
jgi:hypothetical protein